MGLRFGRVSRRRGAGGLRVCQQPEPAPFFDDEGELIDFGAQFSDGQFGLRLSRKFLPLKLQIHRFELELCLMVELFRFNRLGGLQQLLFQAL